MNSRSREGIFRATLFKKQKNKQTKRKRLSKVFLFLKELLFADFWDSIRYLNKCPLLYDFCSYEAEEGARKIQGMNYSLQSTINDSYVLPILVSVALWS